MSFAYAATGKCWTCGLTYNLAPYGMQPTGLHKHRCWLHPLARIKWQAHLEGWHSGYRFAVENADDPWVQTDGVDYGTGWAASMRVGGIEMAAEEESS